MLYQFVVIIYSSPNYLIQNYTKRAVEPISIRLLEGKNR